MSETVKNMLLEDIEKKDVLIDLNKVLIEQFTIIGNRQKKIARRQNCNSILIGLAIVLILIGGILWFEKTRELFLNTMQDKLEYIDRREDTLRYKQELFYRAKNKNIPFSMPIYKDTIK